VESLLAAQVITPVAAHFYVARSTVCLSVVCDIRATSSPCLNRLTDLDVIWQVNLSGPMTYCVRLGLWPPREMGDLGVEPDAGEAMLVSSLC